MKQQLVKVNISLLDPVEQLLNIEYVNESDRILKIEKLNPHTNLRISVAINQPIPQKYGCFAQGIPSYLELPPGLKAHYLITLRRNYDIPSQGSYSLDYQLRAAFLDGEALGKKDTFEIKGRTRIDFSAPPSC